MGSAILHFERGIVVTGTPAPQGSKSFMGVSKNGRPRFRESSKQVLPWRQAVALAALDSTREPLDCPIRVDILFRLAPPASASKKKIKLGPMRKPDLDKLQRATFDALSDARVWVDDSRIVQVFACKRFVQPGEALGAHIDIYRVEFL